MAALPYIQLYVADYLADTMHLTTEEHGAYLLLIMNYWQTGHAIPKKRLASVARMSNERWTDVENSLSEFFTETTTGDWFHARIEEDLFKVKGKSESASAAGKASAAKRAASKPRMNTDNSNECSTNVADPLQRKANHTDTDTDTYKEVNPLSDKSDGVRLANGKQKYKDDAIQVLEFLNLKTGKHYRPLKANLDLIAARLAEGAQVSDCRGIIVRQARKWMGTEQEMYLRPATLFNATKFAQYSGEIVHD